MAKLTGYKYIDDDGEPCIGVQRSDGKFVAIYAAAVDDDGNPWLTGNEFNFDVWGYVDGDELPDDAQVIWERAE